MKKLLILIIVIAGIYFVADKLWMNEASGVTVLNPSPNELVSFPIQVLLEVSGTGGWAIFEGQAGTAQLFDSNGMALTDPELLTGQSSNFAYDFPQTFFADLGDSNTINKITTKDGYISLFSAGAKDGEVLKELKIPVRFSQ